MIGCQKDEVSHEEEPIIVTQLIEDNDVITDTSTEMTSENSDDEADVKPEVKPEEQTQKLSAELSYLVVTQPYNEEAKIDIMLKALQDGSVKWEKTWKNVYISELDSYSEYWVHENRIYIEVQGLLYALNRMNGEEVFKPVMIGVTTIPVVDVDGAIYSEGYYGPFLTKVSPMGEIEWQKNEPENAMWPHKVELDNSHVYVHYEVIDTQEANMTQYKKDTGEKGLSYWLDENEVYFSTVKATSVLKDYPVENVIDGLGSTGWVEGKDDYGIGEKLVFESDSKVKVNHIILENGYHKSEVLYGANGRVKDLRVKVDDGRLFDFTLPDHMLTIDLEFGEDVVTKSLEFEIISVYPGGKYTDTVISSISVFSK